MRDDMSGGGRGRESDGDRQKEAKNEWMNEWENNDREMENEQQKHFVRD